MENSYLVSEYSDENNYLSHVQSLGIKMKRKEIISSALSIRRITGNLSQVS